ncbi:MAG: pirin family protein [Candidatus Caenarcaniphilales bacterium]|nr:pirin family protein [Candidatus Caenarcaniphilales bacterium]
MTKRSFLKFLGTLLGLSVAKSLSAKTFNTQNSGSMPMLKLRKAEERGPSDFGWLQSMHTFSFGHYYDPEHMGFGTLRVINEDKVKPGKGFGTHPHKDMEIISYVLEGALEHKDSMGNGSIIRPGDVQRMSAGTGVTHSEFNPSEKEDVHFLQIWFLPNQIGLKPGYEQRNFSTEEKKGKFKLVASEEGRNGSISLNQDMDMSVAILDNGQQQSYNLKQDRKAWIHLAKGKVTVNSIQMKAGDGLAIENIEKLNFQDAKEAEIIVFDMKS